MEQLVAIVIVAVVTGFFAQAWKGHTGAIWGLISLPIHGFAYLLFAESARLNPQAAGDVNPDLIVALCSGISVMAVMMLIIITLPRRDRVPT